MSRQTMQSRGTVQTIRIGEVNPSLISFEPMQETDQKSPQKYGFMRYGGKSFAMQTPDLILRVGGIPQFNPTYHKKTDAEDRGYAKLALDEEHLGGKTMFDKIKEIDEYFEAHQEVIFGENSKFYQYVPLLRYPNVDEEEVPKENKNSKYPPLPKLPYVRAKLDFYNDTKLLKTELILRDEAGELTKPLIEQVDDIRQHFRLNSEYKAIMTFCKYWVAKTKKSSSKDAKKEWGVSLKIIKLQVKSRPVMTKGEKPLYDFIDDENQEVSEVKKFMKTEKIESVVEEQQEEQNENSEELNEETTQDVEEEEEDLEPIVKKQLKKPEVIKPKGKATGKSTNKKSSKLDL
jgi:hypothetical protein